VSCRYESEGLIEQGRKQIKRSVLVRGSYRAVKGFIILEISLELGELCCVKFSDVK
jgi:hypothetical protein